MEKILTEPMDDNFESSFSGDETNIIKYDIDIEELELGEYCGFEIDGNKRFLLSDFTVTHNTTLARNLGKILNCDGERLQMLSGPEIFNKWVGESESNIGKYSNQPKMLGENLELIPPCILSSSTKLMQCYLLEENQLTIRFVILL